MTMLRERITSGSDDQPKEITEDRLPLSWEESNLAVNELRRMFGSSMTTRTILEMHKIHYISRLNDQFNSECSDAAPSGIVKLDLIKTPAVRDLIQAAAGCRIVRRILGKDPLSTPCNFKEALTKFLKTA